MDVNDVGSAGNAVIVFDGVDVILCGDYMYALDSAGLADTGLRRG